MDASPSASPSVPPLRTGGIPQSPPASDNASPKTAAQRAIEAQNRRKYFDSADWSLERDDAIKAVREGSDGKTTALPHYTPRSVPS